MSPYFAALHALKGIPDLLSKQQWLELTRIQIVSDQRAHDPALAAATRGAVPVFSAEQVQGRLPELVAEELEPAFRQHVNRLAAVAPARLRAEQSIRSMKYDSESGMLRTQASNRGSYELLTPVISSGGKRTPYGTPRSVERLALYRIDANSPANDQGPSRGFQNGIQRGYLPGVRLLAFDRRLTLKGIPLDRARAEQLLLEQRSPSGRVRSGSGVFTAVVEFTVADARRDARSEDGATPLGALVVQLDRVIIRGPKGEQVATFAANAFPEAGERQRQQETEIARREADAAAARQRRDAEKRRKQQEAAAAARARAEQQQRERAAAEVQRRKDRAERQEASRSAAAFRELRSRCESKYRSGRHTWDPVEGSVEYNAAVAACIEEPKRDAYGPDIVGLQLGMERTTAGAIVRLRMETRAVARLQETRPFEGGGLSWSDDAGRGIALFFIKNHGRDLVAGVSRRLYFDGDGPTTAQIVDGLRGKYGPEAWRDGDRVLAWAFPTGPDGVSAGSLAEIVALLSPRGNWSGRWAPRLTPEQQAEAQRRAQEQRQARLNDQITCLNEAQVKANPFLDEDDHSDTRYTEKFNEEMAIFNERFGPTSTASSPAQDEEPRLPIMIGPHRTPGNYAQYGTGPVVIAILNADANGDVTDAAFVLFDPSWIAGQPAFAFKGGGGPTAAAGGGKKKIDF